MEKSLGLSKKDLENIKEIAITNYRYNRSLYISVLEALLEYFKRKGHKTNFHLEVTSLE